MIFGDTFCLAKGNSGKRRSQRYSQQPLQQPFQWASKRLVTYLSLSLSALSLTTFSLSALPVMALGQRSEAESALVDRIALAPPDMANPDIVAANRQLAQTLPENTPIAFFLSTREENWKALERFELFATLSTFLGGSLTPRRLPFFPPGLQFEYDGNIQDWMGDQAAIALLPQTASQGSAVTDILTNTYMVLPVTDQAALTPFLAALETSHDDVGPDKMTYDGVTLWVWPTQIAREEVAPEEVGPKEVGPKDVTDDVTDTEPVSGLTVAMLGDHLIFAQEAATVKTLLDYQQQDVGRLAESALFARSQYSETEGAIARLYSNFSEIVKFNFDGSLPDGSNLPIPVPIPVPPDLPVFSELPSLSLSPEAREIAAQMLAGVTLDTLVYPQAEGLRLQGRLYGNEIVKSTATPELPYADSALVFVPAPTYALSSGRNVAGLWQQVASGLALNDTTRSILEQARSLVTLTTGLDLDTELMGWMDREFVLFFFPSSAGAINSVFPGAHVEVGVALQTSDRATAQKALNALDELVGPETAIAATVNNTPAVSWQTLADNSQPISYLSHSWVTDDTLLVASGAGAMQRLLNAPAFETISEHPTFLNATQSLPHPNNGYHYLNAGSTLSWVYGRLGQWLGPTMFEGFFFRQVQSVLGTIRGFGTTTSSTDEYWQLDSIMTLAPVARSQITQPKACTTDTHDLCLDALRAAR